MNASLMFGCTSQLRDRGCLQGAARRLSYGDVACEKKPRTDCCFMEKFAGKKRKASICNALDPVAAKSIINC